MRSKQRHNFLSNIRNFIERTPRWATTAFRSEVIELVEAPEGIKFLRTCPWSFEILTVHLRVPPPESASRFRF